MRNRERGFSLIELLVVVTIIMVIVAMALPRLTPVKMSANETSAAVSIRALNSACLTYETLYGSFPPSLAALGPGSEQNANSADMIDALLAGGTKDGYRFTYSAGPKDSLGHISSYTILAEPITPGTTGMRSYFGDQSGTIRSKVGGPADATSSPIG